MEGEPHHITAINDLKANYSPQQFRYAVGECCRVIALLVADNDRSDQQVARVHILRYLDLQLSRALLWADDEADLMAIVLRSLIDLMGWAEFVSKGLPEAQRFLNEALIDIQELHQKMDRASPGTLGPLPSYFSGKRVSLTRRNDQEESFFKLCSKLIHPSAFLLNHPEATIHNSAYKEQLAVEVLFYGWLIVNRFHNIVWTTS